MEFLHTLLMFIVAIGVLITVHEFGHFWVARRVGIKVLKFSIGFGPALFSRTGRDGVTYVIAALPLGGFVKMAGEVPGEKPELDPSEAHRAYNQKPVGQRMAVAAAGPMANFLFALVAFIGAYLIGVPGIEPQIGYVAPDSPAAQAPLHVGERIYSVNDHKVQSWNEARMALMQIAIDRDQATLEVGEKQPKRRVQLDLKRIGAIQGLESDFLYREVGIGLYQPVVVGETITDEPAAQAGLRSGDRIVAVNGQPLASWHRFLELVRSHPEQPLELRLERDGETLTRSVRPKAVAGSDGERVGRIGMRPAPLPESLQVTVRYGPLRAIAEGLSKTGELFGLTVEMLGRMVIGSASTEGLAGPIAIAQFAGQSAAAGLVPFLWFLGMISLSLGIVNLLPIPVLDGGHLVFHLIEAIRGHPLNEATLAAWQRVGIAVLLAIMAFAFYNDIQRLLN